MINVDVDDDDDGQAVTWSGLSTGPSAGRRRSSPSPTSSPPSLTPGTLSSAWLPYSGRETVQYSTVQYIKYSTGHKVKYSVQ